MKMDMSGAAKSTGCGVVVCGDAGAVGLGVDDAKHGFTVDDLALVRQRLIRIRRRENNLCQVAGCA